LTETKQRSDHGLALAYRTWKRKPSSCRHG